MFGLSKMINALAEDSGRELQPFNWATPIRPDPFLISQLQRANLELRTMFAVAGEKYAAGSYDEAAAALTRCARDFREMQRVEALRLYPALTHQASPNAKDNAALTRLRVETITRARRFLRLADELVAACQAGQPATSAFIEATATLERYIGAKETQLYRRYALIAAAASAAA